MAFHVRTAALTAMCLRTLRLAGTVVVSPFALCKAGIIKRRAGGLKTSCPALCVPGPIPPWIGSRPIQVFSVLLMLFFLVPSPAVAVPAGTIITNTAQGDYILNGSPQTSYSNSVSITTAILGTPSVLELFRYSPSSPSVFLTVGITPYFDGGGFTPSPAPTDPATGSTINLGAPVPLEPAANFSQDDPVFILLTDPDGNTDPAVADTLVVTI